MGAQKYSRADRMKLPLYAGPERHGELIARPTANFSQSMSDRAEYDAGRQEQLGAALPQTVRPPGDVELELRPHIVPKLIFGRDDGHDGLAVVLRGLNARQRTLRPPESPTLLVLQLVDNGDAIET